MTMCRCGLPVEPWTRFHYAKPHEENAGTPQAGHYVEGPSLTSGGGAPALPESWTPNLRRMEELGFFGPPPQRAPRPGPVPQELSWLREDALRGMCLEHLETLGYTIHDLEQGYRPDGSSRVSEGIGDAYIQGSGARAWIEFKRWDNELTDKQRTFGLAELETGGTYLVVYELRQLVVWHDHITQARREP